MAPGPAYRTSRGSECIEMEADFSAQRGIAVAAIAADAGHDLLVLVHHELVDLSGIRIGVYLGGIVAAVRFLASVRLGVSAMGRGEPRGLRVCAAGIPICRLFDVIAGVHMQMGAFCLFGWIEVQRRLAYDGSLEGTVAAISDTLTTGVDRFEFDRIRDVDCLG